jgi:hypothetical protein
MTKENEEQFYAYVTVELMQKHCNVVGEKMK